jgi:hypothetical protein
MSSPIGKLLVQKGIPADVYNFCIVPYLMPSEESVKRDRKKWLSRYGIYVKLKPAFPPHPLKRLWNGVWNGVCWWMEPMWCMKFRNIKFMCEMGWEFSKSEPDVVRMNQITSRYIWGEYHQTYGI